ncbi:restriction endonuclease [Lactobacillus sp. LL6]|uniref:restriction endonuclease n=1 Tax=Lactobacillus sp. LL6 TaxID=2596827 RepID=UPI0011847533|nr:restriction endonuclease [Lactobacillus sp. LL6]TSO25415.1 restriction endonuclease [Lactobacillus sp. LL6]
MIKYEELKQSSNGMPTWDAFLGPILSISLKKNIWSRKELVQAVVDNSDIPEELRNLRYTSKYHDLILNNRIDWALSDLKIAGLLNTPNRGKYKISNLGKEVYQKYGMNIDREFVHSQKAYQDHRQKQSDNNKNIIDESSDDETIEAFELNIKQVDDWFSKQKIDFADNLLARLRKVNPYKFEKMMTHLLAEMGYKGTDGEELVTQKSNDGGIDRIINKDPLGLETVYVQVKRYGENNTVGSPEINGFYGALTRMHANRGVFITTSSFSKDAQVAAKQLNIALVDGEMLTNLMIQYHIGVQVAQTYDVFDIDEDFFE